MTNNFTEAQQYELYLVHALLGVISSNFRLVSLVVDEYQTIVIRIILEHESEDDLEEIEDFKTEFEALLPGPTPYEVNVEISNEPIPWQDPSKIVCVFRRREP
ncbi:hypothetical protein ES707_09511 [subsurface metagenome]